MCRSPHRRPTRFHQVDSGYEEGHGWRHGNEADAVAIDPKGTLEAARGHAHSARKSAGRVVLSGLGFSVAYFFDPDHGSARRKQAVEVVNHLRRAAALVKTRRTQQTPPTATMAAPSLAAPLRGSTNGVRASASL